MAELQQRQILTFEVQTKLKKVTNAAVATLESTQEPIMIDLKRKL